MLSHDLAKMLLQLPNAAIVYLTPGASISTRIKGIIPFIVPAYACPDATLKSDNTKGVYNIELSDQITSNENLAILYAESKTSIKAIKIIRENLRSAILPIAPYISPAAPGETSTPDQK